MGSGTIDVKPLITDTFAFDDSVKAFDFAVKMPPDQRQGPDRPRPLTLLTQRHFIVHFTWPVRSWMGSVRTCRRERTRSTTRDLPLCA